MTHPVEFEDVWLRFRRAEAGPEHFKAIQAEWRDNNLDAYSFAVERGTDGDAAAVLYVRKRPPREWGLVIGDVLQDLRSSLDYAVFALARKHGPDPLPDPDSVSFPVARPGTNVAVGAIKYLPRGAKDYINSVQPDVRFGTANGFYVLNELVNVHKHRFLPVVWSVLSRTHLDTEVTDVDIDRFKAFRISGELEERTVLAEWHEIPIGPNPKVEVTPQFTFAVSIGSTGHMPLYPVLRIMGELIHNVRSAILQLERHV